jgi:hypothetical protein
MLFDIYYNHPPIAFLEGAAKPLLVRRPRTPYLDLAAKHQRERQRLLEAERPAGDAGQQSPEEARDEARRQQALDELEADVQKLQDYYENNTAGKPLLEKVVFALTNGLGETALNIIDHDPEWTKALNDERTGPGAVRLTLEVLLDTGRLDDTQDVLDPEKGQAGDPAFMQQHRADFVRRAAAAGDYAAADRYLADTLPPNFRPGADICATAAHLVGHFLLRQAPRAAHMPWQVPFAPGPRGQMMMDPGSNMPALVLQSSLRTLEQLHRQSEVYLTRGWLALEAGRTAEADEYLAVAAALTSSPERWGPTLLAMRNMIPQTIAMQVFGVIGPAEISTRTLAERCRGWIAEARR